MAEVKLVPRHAMAAAPLAPEAEQPHGRSGEALERRMGAEMVFGNREVAARRLGAHLLDAAEKVMPSPAMARFAPR